jgi:hypothetical protein
VYSDELKRICITVAEDAVIEVLVPVMAERNQLVEVKWHGRTLLMFGQDIQQRGVASALYTVSAGNVLTR